MTSLAALPERHPRRVIAHSASLTLLPKPDGRIVVGDALPPRW